MNPGPDEQKFQGVSWLASGIMSTIGVAFFLLLGFVGNQVLTQAQTAIRTSTQVIGSVEALAEQMKNQNLRVVALEQQTMQLRENMVEMKARQYEGDRRYNQKGNDK